MSIRKKEAFNEADGDALEVGVREAKHSDAVPKYDHEL